ncbi:MAG: hypothetical protein MJA84_15230 [Firmicutes bacterium]|nr:hypothetical protein [Bacillota bacterium]
MTTNAHHPLLSSLAFGMPGWQEILILTVCPLTIVGIVLLILFLTGVLGGKKNQD